MRTRTTSNPLIRSSAILRGIATAITLTSLSGMTAFAATHVQNTNAPLQPTASTTATSTSTSASPSTSTSTSTSRSTTTTRSRRTTITSGVGTTTSTARTKTAQS